MRLLSLATLVCFTTSCGAVIPERFATVKEAFPQNSLPPSQTDLPPETTVKATFAAPYVDVFRAVMVGATQAQFNVESEDKSKGIILATRVFNAPPPVGKAGSVFPSSKHRYYYGIVIKETGPKSTEVQMVAKRQLECHKFGPGDYLAASILIIVVLGLGLIYEFWTGNDKCDTFAQVQLAAGKHNSEEQMAQFITFTRNNLIAAGAL
jgi:hypothetical protein